ncbi:ABC transporter substrate-binding protein [Pseudomonas sp. WP18]|uniref:ABC transporter substrate-binding protein n=3 Tax=Pseudomonas TaxID=286 RepID=A0A0G3GB49_9PSED|nr:ABC transporter substrate-binding protein [Pseudomonas brassicacearum]AKJ98358.1 ABC transporter substrate-binding protein [Pseudomonas chlororaphis]ROM85814.1 ABC transporter substrate-binding protein [Pseudomonas brassicacearum]
MCRAPARRTPLRGCRRLALGLLLMVGLTAIQARAAEIVLTGAEDSPGVQSFTQALKALRPEDSVRFTPLASLPTPDKLPANVRLVLLDLPSLDWRLQDTRGPATLVLRISRLQARDRLGEATPNHLSLLWSDPPVARQLRLIRAILPQLRRVGVLYDGHSEFLLNDIRQAAAPLGLEIVTERWDDTADSRPLQNLLGQSDVLLGLDDPDLYNPKTVKNLLLSSYARQRPLIGPSAAFVKAGSLASTYSDQDDWLAILDELLDRPATTWPRTLYPARFKVLGNRQVTRSLGIEPIDAESVAATLAEGEHRP